MLIQTRNMLLPRRPFFKTVHLEQARAHLSGLFWPHELQLTHQERKVAFCHNKVNLSSLSINALQYGNEVTIKASPTNDCYLVKFTLDGFTEVRQSGHVLTTTPGTVCVMNPTDQLDIRLSRNHNQLTLRIDGERMHAFLEQELGSSLDTPLVFLPFAKKLSNEEGGLGRLLITLCRDLDAHPDWFEADRLNLHLEEILLSTVLAELPHTYSQLYLDKSVAGIPGKISHVVDYIRANFCEPIGLRELAVIARSSVRSLQMAFKKEYGITPTVFIRNTRLEHAHRLLTLDSDKTCVTDAALASGFTHLGKFSCYYKLRYNQLPSLAHKMGKENMSDKLRFHSHGKF